MANLKWDIPLINDLIKKAAAEQLSKLKIKDEEFEIVIEKNMTSSIPAASVSPTLNSTKSILSQNDILQNEDISGKTISSPLIGTFYSAPSPEEPPFVSAGQKVQQGDVLCIIESMKLMNEIKSEYSGTIKKILVQNGDSVDYNQPIFIIE